MKNQYFKSGNALIAGGLLPVLLAATFALSASAATPQHAQIAAAKNHSHATKSGVLKTKPPGDSPSITGDPKIEKKDKATMNKEIDQAIASATLVNSLDVMKAPAQYLNKKITFTATFNRFADIALDYKKAFRDSRDYVTFFILRPDVGEKLIPMSEMKLFFPRKRSEEAMDVEAGDKIQIVGTVWNTALSEPWIDVEHIKIVEKTTKPEKKHTPEF